MTATNDERWHRTIAHARRVTVLPTAWAAARPWATAGMVVLLVLLGVAYFVAPTRLGPRLPGVDPDQMADDWNRLEPQERLAARNDQVVTQNQIRTTSLQLVAGLTVLAGAVATWENIRLRRQDQRIAEQGQITERFTRAIEQLGNAENRDIRLGGIHALDRIARDSADDRAAVAAVLSAFVRRSAPRRAQPIEPPVPAAEAEPRSGTDDDSREVASDVQAALTALGRVQQHPEPLIVKIDLHDTDLHRAHLRGAKFVEADLTGTDLSRANLFGADLHNARLVHADLYKTNLTKTALTKTMLTDANLVKARLMFAELTGATLMRADLTGAKLDHAQLIKADLYGADLAGTDLTHTDLTDATLTRAKLTRAKLMRKTLTDKQKAQVHQPDLATWLDTDANGGDG